jgi:hypothetical protein
MLWPPLSVLNIIHASGVTGWTDEGGGTGAADASVELATSAIEAAKAAIVFGTEPMSVTPRAASP